MSARIRSVQNSRIKRAMRLRDRRGRRQQRRIIIDGLRETSRALQCGVQAVEIFVLESLLDQPGHDEFLTFSRASGVEPVAVSDEVFGKLAFGDRADGVVMIAAEPQMQLHEIVVPRGGLICVLEALEKPGNLGAIVRTADAAGVSAVIVVEGVTDIYNPNAIRASVGAIFRLPVCAATSVQAFDWLRAQRATIFAARVDAKIPYTAVDFRRTSAIVLGSETEGLSDVWQGESIVPVLVPMSGIVDSLNVSAAAAVLFYEAVRQRQA
jgi:TrmH family RNA methyltransferase